MQGILTEQLWLEGGAVCTGEDTTIRDDKCRRRANPQIDRPPRPPRYVALIGTFRCTIGILSREWWNCSEHFQTSHNPGGNLGDPTISKPACACNTCATCAHLRDTLHLMESYYGQASNCQHQTWDLSKNLHDRRFQGKKFTQKTCNFRHLLNHDKKCVNALNLDNTSKKCSATM